MATPAQHDAANSLVWSAQELWAWSQIIQGLAADLNVMGGHGDKLDPRQPEGWQPNRVISPQFLQAILFAKQNQGAVTWHGVGLIGAWFDSEINLLNGKLAFPLILQHCRFDAASSWSRLESSHVISLRGSVFTKALSMADMKVGNDLLLGGQSEFAEVDLANSAVGGQLDFSGSIIAGALDMNGIVISRSLHLSGSTVAGGIDLTDASIGGNLLMDDKGSFASASLQRSHISGYVDLSGSAVGGKVDMTRAFIGKNLLGRWTEFASDVVLAAAEVQGQIDLTGSNIAGALGMNSTRVGDSVFLGKGAKGGGTYARIEMINATVGGQINMKGANVSEKLEMGSVRVADNILLADCPKIHDLDLHGANIGGQLALQNSVITGEQLILENMTVKGYVLMMNADVRTEREVNLKFTAALAMNLAGCALPSVDMTAIQVQGEFRIGWGPPEMRFSADGIQPGQRATEWSENALLRLRNAQVGAIDDTEDAWPSYLDLTGFAYGRLGGGPFNEAFDRNIARRSIGWFKDWLGRQPAYSPQPYEQLAAVLVTAGAKQKADAILYAGRDRERREMLKGRQWLSALALDAFIGYGYYSLSRIFFVWLPIFTAAGALALTAAIATGTLNASYASDFPADYFADYLHRISYSLDKFLPLLKLHDFHFSKIRLDGWIGYYFDFQQFMGYFLGSLLVAGVTGIAKKSHT